MSVVGKGGCWTWEAESTHSPDKHGAWPSKSPRLVSLWCMCLGGGESQKALFSVFTCAFIQWVSCVPASTDHCPTIISFNPSCTPKKDSVTVSLHSLENSDQLLTSSNLYIEDGSWVEPWPPSPHHHTLLWTMLAAHYKASLWCSQYSFWEKGLRQGVTVALGSLELAM